MLAENYPWVMVADIISPALSVYTSEYNLSNKNSIFLKYFDYCIKKDIELLLNYLLIYYRKYYDRLIYYNNIDFCKENKIKISKIFLEPLNLQEIERKYTNNFLYDLLVNLKNVEEYSFFKEHQVKDIVKKARFLENILDNSEAIGYIRKEFRKVHKFRQGNLNDQAQKAEKRRKNDISDT